MIVTAYAKLNLFLHITGKRVGGYHELQSLVAFTEFGDTLEIVPDAELSLNITGEFAPSLPQASNDNLVMRAAKLLQAGSGARITLTKSLPVGAGLGGGSSDAAAAAHGLAKLWNVPLDHAKLATLGSDMPVCLASEPAWVEGVGETVTPLTIACPVYVVLLNPRLPLLTANVYQAFSGAFAKRIPTPEHFLSFDALIDYLSPLHNTLEAPALALMPVIGELLAVLKETKHCRLARMSGSGATCFGLYENEKNAAAAAQVLKKAYPKWWCVATKLQEK